MLLSKGFELEMYTGTPDGAIVGLSDRIVADLDGFVREPDSRNVEYTTPPQCDYDRLLCDIMRPRQALRDYLHRLGNYTIVPGSTLSLETSDRFYRSDPSNPYHAYIEQTYGTDVVTASVHINVGMEDLEALIRACRLVRVEAPLYLALSASSPFLKGKPTGYHSTRWNLFPQTPHHVPLFTSHRHFVEWTERQLDLGTMHNVRHLWVSVRPNGDCRPYKLNRVELRICDLVADPVELLAIAAFLEARLWQLLDDPTLDPLVQSDRPDDLLGIIAHNEAAAARASLDAELIHWRDGRSLRAHDWIEELYPSVLATAQAHGFGCFLLPIPKILRDGNSAQRWLRAYAESGDSAAVMQRAIAELTQGDLALAEQLCHLVAA